MKPKEIKELAMALVGGQVFNMPEHQFQQLSSKVQKVLIPEASDAFRGLESSVKFLLDKPRLSKRERSRLRLLVCGPCQNSGKTSADTHIRAAKKMVQAVPSQAVHSRKAGRIVTDKATVKANQETLKATSRAILAGSVGETGSRDANKKKF